MQKKTLAIMAAGLGTRFGGLKQLCSFTENHYSILDFSIYDAILAGFNSIVFIVREETLILFKERYDNTLPSHVSVDYVIQSNNDLPKEFKHLKRSKPLGTGHALLSLNKKVKATFALINADDFYGRDAFVLMHNHLFNDLNSNYFIGYPLDKTLSENGTVSRGECYFENDNRLSHIIERNGIEKLNKTIFFIENNSKSQISKGTTVSMNFWGFNKDIFEVAEKEFHHFLSNYKVDTEEFYITQVVDSAVSQGKEFKCLKTDNQWFGVTYKEDVETVSKQISELVEKGHYPKELW